MVSRFKENINKVAQKTSFRIFLGFFLLYKLFFNSFTADILIPRLVSSLTTSRLEANFSTFSLFFGIEAKSVKWVALDPSFSEETIFDAKRLAVRYNLLSLLFLKLKISEVAIESGSLYLHEKNGVWNVLSILKPGKKEEEIPEEEGEPLTEINTYLPLAAEAHVQINGLQVKVWKESEKKMYLNVSDLNFRTDLVSNRFTSIPLSIGLLDQIDSFYLALNPERPIPIELDFLDLKWKQTLPLGILLDWNRDLNPPRFLFTTNLGSDEIHLEYKNKPVHLGVSLNQKIEYFPEKDEVKISQFLLKLMGDNWLSIEGGIYQTFQTSRNVDIKVKESAISLNPLNQTLSQLQGILPDMSLAGKMSLQGTEIAGSWDSLKLAVRLFASDLYFSSGKSKPHKVPSLDIKLGAVLDPSTEEEASAKSPIPLLKELNIENFYAVYNGIKAKLDGNLKKDEYISLQANVEDLSLSDFTSVVGGKVKANVNVQAKDFSFLPADLDVVVDGFRYSLDRSRSPASKLFLSGKAELGFSKPFGLDYIRLQTVSLEQKTLGGSKAVGLQLTGQVGLGEELQIHVAPANLNLNVPNLLLVLPLVLKEKIAPLQTILGNEPSVKAKLDASLGKQTQKFKAGVVASLPGLELNDLNLNADVSIQKGKEQKISVHTLQASAFQKTFLVNLKGNLEEREKEPNPPLGSFFGNLDAEIKLSSKERKYLLKGASFSGDISINAKVKDYDITGSLVSNSSNIHYTNNKCPGPECNLFLVEGIQAQIPLHHNLAWKKQDSLIVGDKSVFIKTYGRTASPNLTISQVVGTHPNIPDLPFEYVKKQPNSPGFTARIDYRENYATIEELKSYSLDGIVLGKNIVFNVGTGEPKNMEFRGNVQIRDIDLRQLMPPKTRDKIDDGKIKADLNITLRDLSEPIANLDLFFSVFQIGEDFGKSALNVISPQNFLMDRITDSYAVKKIDVSLSKGLVYADVFFRRSLLSLFLNLEEGKISQQRMPLLNFLKRAQSEFETYQ